MNAALTWGLIGASDIAATRMIPAIRARGGTIAAVHSSSTDHAESFALTHGIALGTNDLDQMLAAGVDAVYISTTNDRHASSALKALSSGAHVLCEKPLALSIKDAQAMIDRAEATGRVLATNHHLPGSPLHRTVRELVAAGRIGTVLSVKVAHAVLLPERLRGWRVTGSAPGSGVIMDITCHDASVLNPLLGAARKVTAISVQQAAWNPGSQSDAVMTVIEYESATGARVLAQTHDAFTVPNASTSLEVHGTEGTIVVSDAMTQDTEGVITLTTASGTKPVEVDCSADLYEIILESFEAAVSGTGSPTASGADGLAALRVALAAEESARTGRTIELREAE